AGARTDRPPAPTLRGAIGGLGGRWRGVQKRLCAILCDRAEGATKGVTVGRAFSPLPLPRSAPPFRGGISAQPARNHLLSPAGDGPHLDQDDRILPAVSHRRGATGGKT